MHVRKKKKRNLGDFLSNFGNLSGSGEKFGNACEKKRKEIWVTF